MKTIDFVARRGMGVVERGSILADSSETVVNMGAGVEFSLNLQASDMQAYSRVGDNLEIVLADGRVIVLDGFFVGGGENPNRVFISSGGTLNEISFIEGADGALFPQYGTTAEWGKWSPSDELIFVDDDNVMVASIDGDQDVSMLGAGLLGAGLLGGAGTASGVAAAAAVAAGGAALLGGGGETPTDPTPADPAPEAPAKIAPTVNGTGTSQSFGGDNLQAVDKVVTVNGTAEPGSTVTVEVGGETGTVVTDAGGNWEVVLTGNDFPADGTHTSNVTVVDTDGTTTSLVGQTVTIDTTPPAADVVDGTQSTNDLVNGAAHGTGTVTIDGTGEAGAAIAVTIDGTTHTTTVGANGSWSVDFTSTEVVGGERTTAVTIVTTDAAGNSSTTTDVLEIDTVAPTVTPTQGVVATSDIVNGADYASGTVTLTGTGEAGATVAVTIDNTTHSTTVDANGNWSVGFASAEITSGELVERVKIVTTDTAGNSTTSIEQLNIDTVAPTSVATSGTDGVSYTVNNTDMSDGTVSVGGTGEVGSTIVVAANGHSHSTTVDANGNWSVDFTSAEMGGGGDRQVPISITSTDAAGNSAVVNEVIDIDTVATAGISSNVNNGGDHVANFNDAAAAGTAGLVLTGTSEPGTTSVQVEMNGFTRTATVDPVTGNWTATFEPGTYQTGTNTYNAEATAIDAHGNSATANMNVRVDTEVTNFGASEAAATGTDGYLGLDAAQNGYTLTGTMEPDWVDLAGNSTVFVTIAGNNYPATVNQTTGQWSVNLPGSTIPAGLEGPLAYTVTGQDAAGNVSTITDSFAVDTVAPDGAMVTEYTAGVNGAGTQTYSMFETELTTDTTDFIRVEANGTTTNLTDGVDFVGRPDAFDASKVEYNLATPMSNGQQLIITEEDGAGNSTGTYVVLNDGTSARDVSNANLGAHNIETIELSVMDNAELTLTENDIKALSENSDAVTVRGGRDDTVNISGASAQGQTTDADGVTYNIYTLGDSTVYVEDDITSVSIV